MLLGGQGTVRTHFELEQVQMNNTEERSTKKEVICD